MTEKINIMIVDDEDGMREFLRYLLEDAGYGIECAKSGVDALSKFTKDAFHLILADIKMPGGIDGLEMLKRIKETDENVVVIVMTGFASLETAIKAIKYNAYDYITKPFDDPDVVLAAVKKGLDHREEILLEQQ